MTTRVTARCLFIITRHFHISHNTPCLRVPCPPTRANSFAEALSSSSFGAFNRSERNVNNAYAKLFARVGEQETRKQSVLWEMWKWRILQLRNEKETGSN